MNLPQQFNSQNILPNPFFNFRTFSNIGINPQNYWNPIAYQYYLNNLVQMNSIGTPLFYMENK